MEDKIRIKLKKKLLQSEKNERKQNFKKKGLLALLVIVTLVVGIFLGNFLAHRPMVLNGEDAKMIMIEELLKDNWLYANDFENISEDLKNKAYYGMTYYQKDPYTTYQSKEEMESFASNINMDFVGIGITYTKVDDMMFIIEVFEDSPAQKAGLEAGDIVLSIDNIDIKNKTSEEISNMVLGSEGDALDFKIKRSNQISNLKVIRGHYEKTVHSYLYQDIPVLNIMSFGNKTYDECVEALNLYKDYNQLIIDLRDNTGGYQEAVEKIAGLFLKDDDILMRVVDKNGQETIDYVLKEADFSQFKEIVVLINNETASASEVLATALKEQHSDVSIIGETSYGKGVMQTTFPLADGSAIKITTAKWLTSKSKWINEIGIKPDVEIIEHNFFKMPLIAMKDDQVYQKDSVNEYNLLVSLGLDYLGYEHLRLDGYYDDDINEALKDFAYRYDIEFNNEINKELFECLISTCYQKKENDKSFDNVLNEGVTYIVN